MSVDGCCTCAEENSGHGNTALKNSFAFCASASFWSLAPNQTVAPVRVLHHRFVTVPRGLSSSPCVVGS